MENASRGYVERNRRGWDEMSRSYQADHAEQLNAGPVAWGAWDTPESELNVLGDVSGKDILEFGCGAAQFGIKLADLGARVTGFDLSREQLLAGLTLVAQAGVSVRLVQANGEQVPFRDESFDVVFCDHGAMSFADPYRTAPEAARVLRPGGRFAFNHSSTLRALCMPDDAPTVTEKLQRPYFAMHREDCDLPGWQITEFNLGYGDWIRLFRRCGLVLEDLIEIRPEENAVSTYQDFADLAWARRWPAESLWVTRKKRPG